MPDFSAWRVWAKKAQRYIHRAVRPLKRPRSLSRQMAIIAVAITLGAIVVTGIISSIIVSNSFSHYLKLDLQQTVAEEANQISSVYRTPDPAVQGNFHNTVVLALAYDFSQEASTETGRQLWIIDNQGNTLFPASFSDVWRSDDPNIVIPAMRQALQTGQASTGDLPDPHGFWLHYSARGYAVAPIFADGTPKSPIIGVVGVSSQSGLSGGPGFIQSVDQTLLAAGIIVALLAAVSGAILAQRITQPLDRLTGAASKMKAGDLSARVNLPEHELPAEIEQLAQTFNEMAATLQRDVNELRRQERLQRELVANVAHELATPLTAIRGFSEALADNVARDPGEREEMGRIIHREMVRLQNMVKQLRQVDRLESGAEVMDTQPLALAGLVDDTIEVLQGEFTRRQVTARNAIPADFPEALADTDRLTQVMLNLLDNALRHTPEGGQITVEAERAGDRVWVTVADSGAGIAPEHLGRIFDRFYRADDSRSSATGGTGLGLAIVRGIVEAHGGQARAANGPEGGARISFSLALARPELAALPAPEPSETTRKRG